ncbi:MAG: 1-deoxy-D-xylulose-5-phosphate synthase [bacterium]|nr:1-deoxy-D-xylulose-5-phosphate synthase [bacterium]
MILDKIDSPRDLKGLNMDELKELASEIRKVIIEIVSQNGGHLASNLGVVELTIALHYVLNTPIDKIIWDVGHQCYTHKLLTGRRKDFSTLRKIGGLSGFPNVSESEYDCFNTGHASTSISLSLGMAISRDLKGEDFTIVAVVGDGALSTGLAFEALNHAGHLDKNLLVILNSNEMSISRTTGALSGYLNRLITMPVYNRLREDIQELLRRVPIFGLKMVTLSKRIEEGLKSIIVPGALFQELGFRYFGPIDGHNLPLLIETIEKVKRLKGPILLHVVTKKGKGYLPAEEEPGLFHGSSPFDPKTGKLTESSTLPTYSEVFGNTLVELAKENEKVVAITAAMADGCGLKRFSEIFPKRFFDVGICEEHAVTLAAGIAKEGLIPVVAIYSTFLQRGYDQILHDVCLSRLHVVFAIDHAGLVGEDGPTHHGIFDIAYLRHLPNIVIMAPKDEVEFRSMIKNAISCPGPVAIRYPKGKVLGIEGDKPSRIEIGHAEVVTCGQDAVLFAIGNMVYPGLAAVRKLQEFGINVTLVNCRFVKPLDEDLILRLAKTTGRVVTLEDHVIKGGFGSAIIELLVAKGICAKIKCIGLPDRFIEHGGVAELHERYGLDADGICKTVKDFLTTEDRWQNTRFMVTGVYPKP